jgi:aldehyde:ferredoxin oxidoreductase
VPLLYPGTPEDQIKRAEDFCKMRGYDPKTGIPTREILEQLGLKDVADILHPILAKI